MARVSISVLRNSSGFPRKVESIVRFNSFEGNSQMVQTPSKTVTLEEFLQEPETKPASEYMDGQVIQKPMPQGKHSVVQGELVLTINGVVKPDRIARAFPELRCTFGYRSTVPNIAVFV